MASSNPQSARLKGTILRNPQFIIPSLTSGLVIGLLEVALAISFAAFIFTGSLAPFVPYAIGFALASAIICGTIVALFASWAGFVGGNQDVPAAIMALMSVAIAESMPATATAEETFLTVVVAIAISTLLTGLFFLGTGYFHLGGLVRFLPYPVVGGFLAGTGWLLIAGAVGLMAGLTADLFQLPALLQPDMIMRWLPGVLLAMAIMVVVNRVDHYLVLPGMLLLSFVTFFAVAWAGGYSIAELSAGGWLLGPFAGDGLWQPVTPASLSSVYWPAVLGQAAAMAAAVLVGTVSLLLNASGVELAVNHDVDFDKELRVAGVANIFSGLAAGLVGFQQLGFSILNQKLRSDNRLTGLVAVAVCVLAMLAGASLLALFPKIIVGALLFFLGLSFMVEWVVEGWSNLPRVDYAIVITILLVTAFVGFLQAVALGLLLAVILFVIGYSQVNVVRHELTGASYHSRVIRNHREEQLLHQYGQEIYIMQLQGFIFFGTADSLLNQVRRRLYDSQLPHPLAIVLDFEHVTGIDSTAMISFGTMKMAVDARDTVLVICGANKRVSNQLERGGLNGEDEAIFQFDSVDKGVAWCEQRLLARVIGDEELVEESTEEMLPLFARHLASILGTHSEEQDASILTMLGYFDRLDLDAGSIFIAQGEPAHSLYFLAAGVVTARLGQPDGETIRLETMGSGRVIGELGFFLGGERTADVMTDEPSTLFQLSREDLACMEENDPQAASMLRRLVANLLAERVIHLTHTVRALEY